jgi:hypothetical protein
MKSFLTLILTCFMVSVSCQQCSYNKVMENCVTDMVVCSFCILDKTCVSYDPCMNVTTPQCTENSFISSKVECPIHNRSHHVFLYLLTAIVLNAGLIVLLSFLSCCKCHSATQRRKNVYILGSIVFCVVLMLTLDQLDIQGYRSIDDFSYVVVLIFCVVVLLGLLYLSTKRFIQWYFGKLPSSIPIESQASVRNTRKNIIPSETYKFISQQSNSGSNTIRASDSIDESQTESVVPFGQATSHDMKEPLLQDK